MKIFNSTLISYVLVTLFSSLSIANVEAAANRESSRKDVDENSQCDISKRRNSNSDKSALISGAEEKDKGNFSMTAPSRYDEKFKDRKYTTSKP